MAGEGLADPALPDPDQAGDIGDREPLAAFDLPEPPELRALKLNALVATVASWQPTGPLNEPSNGVAAALGILARRYQQLTTDIAQLDDLLGPLVAAKAPALLAINGVGIEVAGQLLVTAGDNPQRGYATRPPSRACAAWLPYPPAPARPAGTASAAA